LGPAKFGGLATIWGGGCAPTPAWNRHWWYRSVICVLTLNVPHYLVINSVNDEPIPIIFATEIPEDIFNKNSKEITRTSNKYGRFLKQCK